MGVLEHSLSTLFATDALKLEQTLSKCQWNKPGGMSKINS